MLALSGYHLPSVAFDWWSELTTCGNAVLGCIVIIVLNNYNGIIRSWQVVGGTHPILPLLYQQTMGI
jgi:hypothetical protein